MVEEECKLHLVATSPPTLFDAAMLLRTLYAGLGAQGWCASIIGLGGRLPARLVTESRTPVKVLKQHVSLQLPAKLPEPIYAVDPRGTRAYQVEEPPRSIVIDYSGAMMRAYPNMVRVSGLGTPLLTYEAAAVIYEFFIRRASRQPTARPIVQDPRSGLYLARKALEALRFFDNYPLLEPNTLLYAVRRIYLSRGFILEPRSYRVEIDPVTGEVKETIEAEAYSRRGLKPAGTVTIRYDTSSIEIIDWKGSRTVITVEPERLRACAAPGLCAVRGSAGEEAEATEPLQGLFEGAGE
jgi:hypothetical protein